LSQDAAEPASQSTEGKRKLDHVPSSYCKKYEHLLGKSTEAARAADANKAYGFGLQIFLCVF